MLWFSLSSFGFTCHPVTCELKQRAGLRSSKKFYLHCQFVGPLIYQTYLLSLIECQNQDSIAHSDELNNASGIGVSSFPVSLSLLPHSHWGNL